MARIRSIKPEFWSDEQVMECSPFARLLFIGLWNFCDDGGNHPMAEKTIKALVFPGDDVNTDQIRRALVELSANALLQFYESGGKRYLNVKGWRHQKIDRPSFKYPKFEDGDVVQALDMWPAVHQVAEYSPTARQQLDGRHPPEGKGGDIEKDQDQKTCPISFDEFWKLYPRKVCKAAAHKAWQKAKPDMIKFAQITEALEKAKRSPDWLKDSGKFIPHAATWLNGQRWEDEIDDFTDLPYDDIANAYNEICGKVFKACEGMPADRKLRVRTLARERFRDKTPFIDGGVPFWKRFFVACSQSKSWAGQNQNGFIANFDHVIKNAATVLEGVRA